MKVGCKEKEGWLTCVNTTTQAWALRHLGKENKQTDEQTYRETDTQINSQTDRQNKNILAIRFR